MGLDPPFSCKDCNEQLRDHDALNRHMAVMHNKVPWVICKLCNEKIVGEDEFDKHLQYTHGTNHWDLNLGMKAMRRIYKDMLDKPG